MKQGKFRKDNHNFDLREVVNEVMLIQTYQAKAKRVELGAEFIGFGQGDNSFIMCSDSKRVQQVILNLQSNALKFTPTDGSVTIICRRIKKRDALNHPEEHGKCLQEA